MSRLNTTLAAALVAGGLASFSGPAGAVPLGASLSLREASTPLVDTVQWRGWRGRAFGGLAAAAIIGGAIAASRPYYGYGYGYGYPAYSYGYGPAYYSYAGPSYGYGYSYAYPSYGYGYSYGYAPAYSYSYADPYYAYASVPRVRYRAVRAWRGRW